MSSFDTMMSSRHYPDASLPAYSQPEDDNRRRSLQYSSSSSINPYQFIDLQAATPSGPPPPRCPPGWMTVFSEQYKEWFYLNTYTEQSQWHQPTEPAQEARTVPPPYPYSSPVHAVPTPVTRHRHSYSSRSTSNSSRSSNSSPRSPKTSPRSLPSIPNTTPSSPSTMRRPLSKPIAIPATSAKVGSPFLRAYPPALGRRSISQSTFLHFLDNLNRVAVASPPLQVLSLAGQVVGFVPEPTAMIVSMAVSTGSNLGIAAVSKGRTEMFLRKSNKELFGPLGLKVEVAKLDAVAKVANIPILDGAGRLDPTARILGSLDGMDAREKASISGQQRRLDALRPWIAELEVTPLPAIEAPTSMLSKLSVAASERSRKTGEQKLIKGRMKTDRKSDKAEHKMEKKLDKLERKEEKAASKGKDSHKIDRKYEKVERKFESKVEAKGVKKDKEEKAVRQILWVIIRNIDDDSGTGPDPYLEEA